MTAVLEDRSEGLVRERPSVATLERIRLMVVDDHPAVRRGLRELLEDQPDFLVVATVSSAEDAMSLAERKRLDVAVSSSGATGCG
jgi:DNA-binding NarL/FixJ family response regulator